MIPGFLPLSRAPFMMDVVTIAMVVVVPLLIVSLSAVRFRRRFGLHKRLQLSMGLALLIAVALFEIDVRLNGWQEQAEPSPYYDTWLFPLLYVHLTCAISTTILWVATIAHALRSMPLPPGPSPASATHRRLGRLAAIGMLVTAVTGWTFYYAAFVAGP